MARIRVTARKSVAPITHRDTIQLDYHQPRTRVQAAIRLKELALDNQNKTIRRLRTSNYERRQQVENLTTKLMAAEKRIDEIFHMFELTRGHNFELRDSLEIAAGQAKCAKEEVDRRTMELSEARQARLKDKKKVEESWTTIMQLSENNQRLSKEVDKGKVKKKELIEKNKENCVHAKNVLDEDVEKIMSHIDEITDLKFENQNLHWQIENLMNPDEPEEEPEEEEVPPDVAMGNGEIE